MNKRRRKIAYLLLVLLILLVVAIIGGLAYILFNMTTPVPSADVVLPELKTNVVEQVIPVTETYIEVQPEKIEEPKIAPKESPKISAGITPAICEGYGPQIKQRDAYDHPVTHKAQVQANHVQFTLYSDKKLNAKGSD